MSEREERLLRLRAAMGWFAADHSPEEHMRAVLALLGDHVTLSLYTLQLAQSRSKKTAKAPHRNAA